MEPLTITTGCLSLLSGLLAVSSKVKDMVDHTVQKPRELSDLQRELDTFQESLDMFCSTGAAGKCPLSTREPLSRVIGQAQRTVSQLTSLLSDVRPNGVMNNIKWLSTRDEIKSLQQNLESHKASIDIAFAVASMSINCDIKSDTSSVRSKVAHIPGMQIQLHQLNEAVRELALRESSNLPAQQSVRRWLNDPLSFVGTAGDKSQRWSMLIDAQDARISAISDSVAISHYVEPDDTAHLYPSKLVIRKDNKAKLETVRTKSDSPKGRSHKKPDTKSARSNRSLHQVLLNTRVAARSGTPRVVNHEVYNEKEITGKKATSLSPKSRFNLVSSAPLPAICECEVCNDALIRSTNVKKSPQSSELGAHNFDTSSAVSPASFRPKFSLYWPDGWTGPRKVSQETLKLFTGVDNPSSSSSFESPKLRFRDWSDFPPRSRLFESELLPRLLSHTKVAAANEHSIHRQLLDTLSKGPVGNDMYSSIGLHQSPPQGFAAISIEITSLASTWLKCAANQYVHQYPSARKNPWRLLYKNLASIKDGRSLPQHILPGSAVRQKPMHGSGTRLEFESSSLGDCVYTYQLLIQNTRTIELEELSPGGVYRPRLTSEYTHKPILAHNHTAAQPADQQNSQRENITRVLAIAATYIWMLHYNNTTLRTLEGRAYDDLLGMALFKLALIFRSLTKSTSLSLYNDNKNNDNPWPWPSRWHHLAPLSEILLQYSASLHYAPAMWHLHILYVERNEPHNKTLGMNYGRAWYRAMQNEGFVYVSETEREKIGGVGWYWRWTVEDYRDVADEGGEKGERDEDDDVWEEMPVKHTHVCK